MARLIVSCLAMAMALAFAVQVEAESSDASLLYDQRTFENIVPQMPHVILFYVAWCGHCKRLLPLWEDLSAKYDGPDTPVVIAMVDCNEEPELCATLKIDRFPIIKLFTKETPEGVNYTGKRDMYSLNSWIKTELGIEGKLDSSASPVLHLTKENFHGITKSGMYFVKLYTPWCSYCKDLASTWDELAEYFRDDEAVHIAVMDCDGNKELCDVLDAKTVPTLVFVKDGKVVEKFGGTRSLQILKAFVEEMKQKHSTPVPEQKVHFFDRCPALGSAALGDQMVLNSMPAAGSGLTLDVMELNRENFKDTVSSGVSFVKFFAPWCGHCKRLAPTWEELGKRFLGNEAVRICKVDCTADQNVDLCEEMEVRGYPTLFLFKDGRKIREYNEKRDLEMLFTAVSRLIKDEL